MKKEDFILLFANEFDYLETDEISFETVFHDLDEWSSIVALGVQVAIQEKCGKVITLNEMRSCTTIEDLYNKVNEL